MNEMAKKRLYRRAFALLERAQALLLAARAKHEKIVAEQYKRTA